MTSLLPHPVRPDLRTTITQLVAHWVHVAPDAPAIRYGADEMRYGELSARADQLAARLAEHGVSLETAVAVVLPRGPELVVTMLAVLRAGGYYVPLDPAYPVERQRFILTDSHATLVVTDAAHADKLPADSPPVLRIDDQDSYDPADGVRTPPVDATPDGAAYLIYTSGSTGRPKGVVVDHASVTELVTTEPRIAIAPGDVVAQLAPTSFDASTFEIWGALCRGGTLVLFDTTVVGVAELAAQIRRWRPDWLFLTTGLFHLIARYDPAALDSVGCLIAGGDVLSPEYVAEAARRTRLYAAYGPTETTVFASLHAVTAPTPDRVPIGTPLAGMHWRVLDPQLRPVPDGEIGEIVLGGVGIARGYHGQPELTAERFLPDPFSPEPGRRMYRTGDRGARRPDGALDFHGRLDRQVKIRGFRVELGEIEAVLRRHPDLADALSVAVSTNAEEKRIAAYAVPHPGRQVNTFALRAWLGERLPGYLMPATLVLLEDPPLDPNGKPDRSRLPAPWTARADLPGLPDYCAPATDLQRLLCEVSAEVLELDQVGVDDDFFELGGDSLRSVWLLERLRSVGVEISAGEFFGGPTPRDLADLAGARSARTPEAARWS
ncbi:amino acid adenylation domain-containing protein [Micromonospora marina]|uniref:Amino acid adenylation domain-containing protein n=1 Tax=Micromonospora marina TaxID=307120 RepID=A0A1C5AJW1_9ACTN|nr:non-ribosomal peptide synthetase [Micromonospora marina]SCF45386.1 amino acid adenylation domain-containing protein [Micromonospora marina]